MSATQVQDTRDRGWSLLKAVLPIDAAQGLRNEIDVLVDRPDDFPDCMYFYGGADAATSRLTRVERIWESLGELGRSGLDSYLLTSASEYLGEEAVLFKDKLNIRAARSNGYAPHQDSAAGWDKFGKTFVSFGLFLARSDPFHGGFEVVSGSHRNGRYANDKGRMSDADFETLGPVALTAELGDIVVLDSETPHRTLQNRSDEDILHLLFTFAPGHLRNAREAYYEEKRRSFASRSNGNRFEFRVFAFE